MSLPSDYAWWNVYMSDVTRILHAIEQGDEKVTDELLPLVYEELRRLAAQKLSHELPDQTLQATALVHEACIRLVGNCLCLFRGGGYILRNIPCHQSRST